ncbi:glucose dehydrogenase [FAD, quinone] [Manduca sexta]|uniref:glucose dehydrogenase [FAD, quinone] n=1 Tax=Manduca sexta TaxID=7130 RepID=UPI00188F0A0F|nr:glucose dehydrogenase [FAD, quinone] [Manduca sexta]
MSSHPSIKSIVSSSRIMFGLLPGLGALIVIRMAIHLYRPDIEDSEHRVQDRNIEEMYDCYDFIIVGGGSAGAVLANRLSENPNWNVLLLEAGPDENVLSEVPILFPTLQTSAIDWQFVTERSDQYCVNMVDRRCKWPRGKVLGGSSVLNAMLYIRGNKRDYDNWENMGNPGWGYEDVLPYFIKSEDIRIPEHLNDPYHGTGGPLTVEYFRFEHPITSKILEAATQLGYDVRDVNGEFQTGFTRSQATVRDGLRCSTAKAFLRPVSQRRNLHISLHSLVEKVLIDENNTAYGVKFVKRGQHKIIKASKEVILSAGSIQSPQLLMLSGIGDAQHLKEVGIHPIVNSPGVGRNLQDHVAMGGHSFLFDNPYKNESDYCFNLNTVFSIGSLMDFSLHKTGVMYSMIEAEAMAFVNTKFQDPAEDYPDVQLFIAPTADNMDGGLFGKRANGLTDETYAELYEDILYESSFSVVPLLLRPKSRGYIRLRDSNPYSPPLIYPNYFTEPDDVKVLIEGARIAQALVEQPALKALNARPNSRRNPGCAKHELMSDEHLECQARHHTFTIYHPVGTCAMGPDDDPGAVVDSRLRVYGIKNLRVVDGSIMPTIVSGNTNAPIIMIAEKASDIIKEDWFNIPEDIGAVCPVQNKLKNSESEDPTKIDLISKRLDVFNETANLFPVLSKHIKFDETKSRINNGNEQPAHTIVDKKTPLKTILTANSFTNDVKNPLTDMAPSYSKPYPDVYGYIPPLLPPPPPLPYFPITPDNTYYNTYNQNPIHESVTTYPYNEPIDINTFKINSKFKHRKNKFTKKLPVFPNLNNRFSFINYRPSYEPIPYYETKEEVSPNGQRKCRIWLYYDGIKYEVIL